MRKKKGFKLRDVCGENVIVAEGYENIDFSKIISMNESAAYAWKGIGDGDFTASDVAQQLQNGYEVDAGTALKDAETLTQQWLAAGIIE